MEWSCWFNVLFSKRHRLPSISGIYVIADANNCVWYVGQATNLKSRWAGRTHHRYPQLIRSNRKLCHRIYWQEVPMNSLDEFERYYIDLFKPTLNGYKVKKYLPSQPLVLSEIKRLLKVLNKPTTLFPVIRSVVAGEYQDLDGTNCIVIIININDEQIIINSMQKRYASLVKKAWTYHKNNCEKNEQIYSPTWIKTYHVNGNKFEFVVADWEFFEYLINNPHPRTSFIGEVEIFGVQVKALKDLSIFDNLSFQEYYNYINSEGKKSLTPFAYLNYRKPVLKCIIPSI